MPVTTVHRDYQTYFKKWTRCRDAFDGSDAIKAAGEAYLPKLSGQTTEEYEAYKARALWYGATTRTVQGLAGAIFRKAPAIRAPTAIEPHLDDITLTGVPLPSFAHRVLQEVLITGRYGILVDMASQEAPEQRPYWVGYPAESICNWASIQRGGDAILSLVVLHEIVTEPGADDFEWQPIPQYRVLRLDPPTADRAAQYTVEIWRQREFDGKQEWVLTASITPLMRGKPLDFIPFCFVGPSAITPDVEKPPLLDLVDVNLSHYRSSADLEHGRHFCGCPTAWVAGFPEHTVLKIGSATAWVSSDPQARAGFLEFTGQGLQALETALATKEKLMAVLGARMLEESKRAVEAAETHMIRQSGEQSALQDIASTVSLALTKTLRWHALWAGAPGAEATFELNRDFIPAEMDPAQFTALMRAWQSGAMSWETLYWNLQRGELTRPGIDAETERRLIEEQQPARIPIDDSAQ